MVPRMDDWSRYPVFGEPVGAGPWLVRPSAYALVEGDGARLALVRTREGLFLPGGGIEAGETPAMAISREALEECGLVIRPGAWVIRATRFVYSVPDTRHYEKRSVFMDAEVVADGTTPSEPDHELVWIAFASVSDLLTDESHRWAFERWRSREP